MISKTPPIIVVSHGLAPRLTGSSNIVDNLSRQFARDQMILAGEFGPEQRSYSHPAELPPMYRLLSTPRRGGRWLRKFLFPLMVHRLRRLVRQTGCKKMVAVFPSETYLHAAYLVAKQCNVEFYPYFHNTYLENRQPGQDKLARWLQPRVFELAPLVLVMSEGMANFYRERFPSIRFEPLVHSFNGELPAPESPPKSNGTVSIALLGNVNQSNRDAISRFGRVLSSYPNFTLTTLSSQTPSVFEQIGLTGDHIVNTSVPYDQVTKKLAEHDVVMMGHGLQGGLSDVEYETIFPTRTIPCLLSQRPILLHSPKNSFLTAWFRKYGCAEIVEEPDEDAIRNSLDRVRGDSQLRSELTSNGLAAVKQFSAPSVISRFRSLIDWETQT